MTDHDDVVRDSFTRQVGLFSGPDSPFVRRTTGSATERLEPLDAEMLVLDVACGAGHVAEVVAPQVRTVVGIDLTVELLELGAERLAQAGIANVVLQEGNAEALPFVAGSFDLVSCLAALHHIGDPHARSPRWPASADPAGGWCCRPPRAVGRRAGDVRRAAPTIDPSHHRAHLEAELVALLPDGYELSYGATASVRLPVSIAYTEQSDADAVDAALRAELAGGPATGFEPSDEDGELVVAFWTRPCTPRGPTR